MVFSFAVAPVVFVVLHLFTLIRYDLLASDLRQLSADLRAMVEQDGDRERCPYLLANVEFIVTRFAMPWESRSQSLMFRWVSFGLIAIFPVAVLLAVQISALRYQSNSVIWAERSSLIVDLLLLLWFLRRQRLGGSRERNLGLARRLGLWVVLLWAPAAIVAMNFAWLRVPDTDADIERPSQPLDLLLCDELHWGCRFLTVDHRYSGRPCVEEPGYRRSTRR